MGPVSQTLRNEAHAAIDRARRWLAANPAPASDFPASTAAEPDPDPGRLVPLLAESATDDGPGLYRNYALLARWLDRNGQSIVFIDDQTPLAWRDALLGQIVRRQRIDANGGGYWLSPGPAPRPAESTADALEALAAALGDPLAPGHEDAADE
jgi:hypothetical protein